MERYKTKIKAEKRNVYLRSPDITCLYGGPRLESFIYHKAQNALNRSAVAQKHTPRRKLPVVHRSQNSLCSEPLRVGKVEWIERMKPEGNGIHLLTRTSRNS